MDTLIFIDSKRSLVEKSFFEILILFNYVQYIFKNVKRDFFKSMYSSSGTNRRLSGLSLAPVWNGVILTCMV